jgi:aspartate carbamoyltransferase catalytic subunit
MELPGKDLLDMESLSREHISRILDTAETLREISERPIKKVPTLRGKTVVLFFHEASTRTKTSFDVAAKRLSADTHSLSQGTSSLSKGETLEDTARTLEAMHPDAIVIRHSCSGAPHQIARLVKSSVINAGDGLHAHPTQALLDLLTVRRKKGRIKGLKISIVGDIAHSRVARSDIVGFSKMGADVTICGPRTMIPSCIERLGCRVINNADKAVEGADVVMMLRIQKERLKSALMASERDYAVHFGLNSRRMRLAAEDAIIMHPGPLNRGVEIAPDVADGPNSVILEQVENGVAVRMAVLYELIGGKPHAPDN